MQLNNRDDIERKLARALITVNNQTRRQLIELLGEPPSLDRLTDDVWLQIQNRYASALTPSLESVFIEAALNVSQGIGYQLSVDVINDAAERFARQYGFDLVRGITDRRKRKLQQVVGDFFRDEITNADVIRTLEREYGPVRASQIAVTEVTRATSEGEARVVQDLRQQGADVVAVWNTLEDERVCPICGPRNEKRQGDVWQMLPPAHVNCRCFVTYEVIEVITDDNS